MTTSVVFIHGLWIHSVSWLPWRQLFEDRGYHTLAPHWPGDRDTVAATRADTGRLLDVGVDEITDSYAEVVKDLPNAPIVVGHSFGGLIAQKLLDRGLAAGAVCLSPAPIKGVRAVPLSLLRSSFPVLRSPANKRRTVSLTERQFAYAFGNAISSEESEQLYNELTIPSPGRPLFEASTANFRKTAPTAVDTHRGDRGPLLLIAAGQDHTVPSVVVRGAHQLYVRQGAPADLRTYEDRGHSAPFDHGWLQIAEDTLAWLGEHDLKP
ncbi:alpha/beta hydrolase (plasmid) [Streptomyces sp. NBC_00015]|uniref:alpha/beta hydrolase n=1 Tax=unclassified Streptomyces TaxID=2593676 RepID=UPI002F915E47